MNELQREANRIVGVLRANASFHKRVQATLRRYVTDKSLPLDERFHVWSIYCDKECRDSVLARGDFGIIGDMVRDCKPYDYDRYRTYTWEDFLECIQDEPEEFGVTVEQFKELLMETNFGSFVMDW